MDGRSGIPILWQTNDYEGRDTHNAENADGTAGGGANTSSSDEGGRKSGAEEGSARAPRGGFQQGSAAWLHDLRVRFREPGRWETVEEQISVKCGVAYVPLGLKIGFYSMGKLRFPYCRSRAAERSPRRARLDIVGAATAARDSAEFD